MSALAECKQSYQMSLFYVTFRIWRESRKNGINADEKKVSISKLPNHRLCICRGVGVNGNIFEGNLKMLRLFVIFAVFVVGQALTPTSFLSTLDKARLKGLFEAGLADEASVSYAILGLQLLGETIPNASGLCKTLQVNVDKNSVTAEAIFAASGAAKALGSCTLKLNDQANQVLYKAYFL